MKLSYCICTHNEGDYVGSLLELICKNLVGDDEIIVVDDYSDDNKTLSYLKMFSDHIKSYQHHLNGDFSAHKNFAASMCTGDAIFSIDADEYFSGDKISRLRDLTEKMIMTGRNDVIILPRINMLDRMDEHFIATHKITSVIIEGEEKKIINYPDWQIRIWSNKSGLRFSGIVHETLSGYKKPFYCDDIGFAIEHIKTFDRQMKQDELYRGLISNANQPG